MIRGAAPRVFRMCAPVWQADVDAFGELRPSVLLRFLQETATRASTDAGFDPTWYERAGTMWLVRRSTLTMAERVGYGEELEATTWIAAFRRVVARRDYEVRSAGRLIARARSDWVYVDRGRSQPRSIPLEMQRAFAAEGGKRSGREALPTVAVPAYAARFARRVELHELDALQHVNNAVYVHYLEQAAHDAAAARGWCLGEQVAHGGRLRAVAHDLEYLQAAVPGDALSVYTWPTAITPEILERHTLVSRGDARRPLVRAVSTYRWIDVRTGAPCAMPRALRAALQPPESDA